jgi:hypothetical protein
MKHFMLISIEVATALISNAPIMSGSSGLRVI